MWNTLQSILLHFVNPMTEIKSCSQLIAIFSNVAVLKFVQICELEMFTPESIYLCQDTKWYFVVGM